jgi:hypothetical protein
MKGWDGPFSSRNTETVRKFFSLVWDRTSDLLLAWLTRKPLGYTAYIYHWRGFEKESTVFVWFSSNSHVKHKNNSNPHRGSTRVNILLIIQKFKKLNRSNLLKCWTTSNQNVETFNLAKSSKVALLNCMSLEFIQINLL